MSLAALQRDFRRWLMEESSEAALNLGGEAVAAGLAVYLNNYRSALLACLAESFTATRAYLGETAFNGAAATHIDRVPPGSWTLDAYAHGFARTLTQSYPEDPEVGELATLESGLAECFVGPDSPQVTAEALGEVDWDRAVLTLVPTFRVLPARTNAAALWSAINAGDPPPPAALLPQGGSLALWRQGFTPTFRTLEAGEAEALALIARGASFGELCASLVADHGESSGAAMAGAWLGQWLSSGLIAAIR
jgi:hypothetical protein